MTKQREKLIELLNEANQRGDIIGTKDTADFLLDNGIIVAPAGYGKAAIYGAISALADMVAQFGYSTTFRKQEAVCDGGLSALENAFNALWECGCRLNSNGTITLKRIWEFQDNIEAIQDEALGGLPF